MASAGEATDKIFGYLIDPPSTPDFSGKVGLNFAKGLVTSNCSHVGDLHAVGWWEFVTPVKAIRAGVEGYKKAIKGKITKRLPRLYKDKK